MMTRICPKLKFCQEFRSEVPSYIVVTLVDTWSMVRMTKHLINLVMESYVSNVR